MSCALVSMIYYKLYNADFPEVVMKRTIIEALIIIAIVVVIWLAFVYSMRWWLLDILYWLWRLAD